MADLTTYDYDIFLSHNHTDQEWTTKLAERLEQEVWQGRKIKVFFSPWDIRPGQSIPMEIERALPKSRKVGLIMSPNAVESAWVELERLVTTYIAVSSRDERLIPLYRRDCEIPALLQPVLYIDFRDDVAFEESYRTLLAVIKDEPLPRGSRNSRGKSTALPPLIPRPPVVGFVARRDSDGHDIVERLKEELAPEKNQLIVLSGPGGVGKTTLAAEATRALSGSFRQRIVWTSALGRDDFALSTLLDEVATQLGHPEIRPLAPEPKAEQAQALIASTLTLIILDNFETIPGAEQTRCVGFLLNRASCPALITTRQKIPSARNITIPVMSPEEANDFLQRLIEQASEPSAFAELDRGRIMQASERNPLVMQWVMGQIDLAQDANRVLAELAQGGGDAAQRVFDRSFGLEQLVDDGCATLLALSLFSPDASRAALADVAGFGDDLKRLDEAVRRLAGLYLVKTVAVGSRLTVAALTRELAKARLSKDEHADEFRQRFVAYFLSYSKAHRQPTPENYDALETEKDNLLSATDVALDLKDWDSVQRITDALAGPVTGMLSVHGHWDEAIRRGEQALESAKLANNDWAVAQFAANIAAIRINRGEYDEARLTYQQALEAFRKLGVDVNIAVCLHNLATIAQGQGDLSEAHRFYNESLEIRKKLDDQNGISDSLHQMGTLAEERGDLNEARQLYDESLAISKKLGNLSSIAATTSQLGIIHLKLGERTESRAKHEESLALRRKTGDQLGIAIDLHQLGRVAEDDQNNAEAARLFREALAIFEKLKSPNAELARRSLERLEGKSS